MSKTAFFLVGGLVLAGVVYQILARVPTDALNVALGVMCGIGASIPVSLGLLIALTRQRQQTMAQGEWSDPEPEPVRVIQQPAPRVAPAYAQPSLSTADLYRRDMQNTPVQPQIIVLTPQGQFAPLGAQQGAAQTFNGSAQWANQPYPYMHEQVNTVDAREWRIIGEE